MDFFFFVGFILLKQNDLFTRYFNKISNIPSEWHYIESLKFLLHDFLELTNTFSETTQEQYAISYKDENELNAQKVERIVRLLKWFLLCKYNFYSNKKKNF